MRKNSESTTKIKKSIAYGIYQDVKPYIENHREEYEAFLKEFKRASKKVHQINETT